MSELQVVTKKATLKDRAYQAAILGSTFALATASRAEGELAVPDMTPIVTMISGMVAVVASVGMAVLSVYATAKIFKWVKTAF